MVICINCMLSEGFWGCGGPAQRKDMREHEKKKAQPCIVELQEERGDLNEREGENWQRKGLTMSPNGIKLSRNPFISNCENLAAA